MRAVGFKTLKSSSGAPVYEFSELKAEGKYKPGDPKETRRPKKAAGISKQATNKSLPSSPTEVRGPIAVRREDQKRAIYVENADDDVDPYADTIWLRDRGHFRPMSLNKKHLQRRFDRLNTNLNSLKAELEATKKQLEDHSNSVDEVRSSYEVKLAKATSELEATQADLQHLLLDVTTEEPREVSFRTETGEYDPSFKICSLRDVRFDLHLLQRRNQDNQVRVRGPYRQENR